MIVLDHPWNSAGQREAFRVLLDAWARPATIVDCGRWCGGGRARLVVLAGLCDAASSLADPQGLLDPGDHSRLGAAAAAADQAAFVVADAARAPLDPPPCRGSLLTPERGATLVLDCQAVGEGPAVRCTGPGIESQVELRLLGLHPAWWPTRASWCEHPLGVDLIICDARRIVCIPRTTRVEG